MIRHQWAMECLCGPTLYFEVWFKLNGQSSALGNRFKGAMNDAFDDFVGGILHRTVDKSPHLRLIVDEPEMQDAWRKQKGKTPSVCDWMMFGEGHCVVIDATNHPVSAGAAQGLASFDDYSAEIQKIFVEGKFEQLLSTIDHAQKLGGWKSETVDANTMFAPLDVVPDAGVPNALLTQFDIVERGRTLFEHLQPHVYASGIGRYQTFNCSKAWPTSRRKFPSFRGRTPT
jgi:hypothetical protein